ncbi:hypothetical protein ACTXT7_005752 [Hymenolepis weldensis]
MDNAIIFMSNNLRRHKTIDFSTFSLNTDILLLSPSSSFWGDFERSLFNMGLTDFPSKLQQQQEG